LLIGKYLYKMSRILEHIIRKLLFEQDPSAEERRQDYDARYKISLDPKETEAKVQLFLGTTKQISAAKRLGAKQVLLVKVTYSTDAVVNPVRIYDIVEDAIAIDFKSNAAIQPYASQDYLFVIGNPSNESVQYVPVIIFNKQQLQKKEKNFKKSKKYQEILGKEQELIQKLSYDKLSDEQIQSFLKLLRNNVKYIKSIQQAIAENFFNVPAGEPYFDYIDIVGNKEKYNQDLAWELHNLQNTISKAIGGDINSIKRSFIQFPTDKQTFNMLQFLWEPDRINNLDNEYKTAIDSKTFREDFSKNNIKSLGSVLNDVNLIGGGLFRNDVNGGKFISIIDFIKLVKQLEGDESKDIEQLNSLVNTKGFMNSNSSDLQSLYQVNYLINLNDSLMLTILKDLELPVTKQNTIPNEKVELYKKLPMIHRIILNYNQLSDIEKQNNNLDVNTIKNKSIQDLTQLRIEIENK